MLAFALLKFKNHPNKLFQKGKKGNKLKATYTHEDNKKRILFYCPITKIIKLLKPNLKHFWGSFKNN